MGRIEYYATLARRLEPADLARTVARRAYRSAKQALYRPGMEEHRLFSSLGVQERGELAARVLDARAGQAWCEVSQRQSARAAVQDVPGAWQRAVARAEAAVVRAFDVFGTRVCFGESGRTDWSLDPVSGHHYPVAPSEELTPRRRGVDPKAAWVLGRLDQLIALGQGYWLAGDRLGQSRYARAFVEETADFLQSNPVGLGIHWACPMEVALRAANLAQALAMFADAPEAREPDFLVPVLASLAEHCDFVEAHLGGSGRGAQQPPGRQLRGPAGGGPALPGAAPTRRARWRSRPAACASRCGPRCTRTAPPSRAPFRTTGSRWSCSPWRTCRAQRCGVALGANYEERLERMFEVDGRATSPEPALAPQLGDNDSGRVFPLPGSRRTSSTATCAPLGAALFGRATLKRERDGFPDEAAWLLGKSGLDAVPGRCPRAARSRAAVLPRGGLGGAARRRRGGDASVGHNGQRGVGGHSHNDKLSFELHLEGAPVIVDPGHAAPTRGIRTLRNAYRSTAAHNTIQMDGRELAPLDPAAAVRFAGCARSRVEIFQPGGAQERLAARHGRLRGG